MVVAPILLPLHKEIEQFIMCFKSLLKNIKNSVTITNIRKIFHVLYVTVKCTIIFLSFDRLQNIFLLLRYLQNYHPCFMNELCRVLIFILHVKCMFIIIRVEGLCIVSLKHCLDTELNIREFFDLFCFKKKLHYFKK